MTTNPFLAAMKKIPAIGPAATSRVLPACPFCCAPALKANERTYTRWDRIDFDCHCAVQFPSLEYHTALKRLWQENGTLPAFVASLPPKYVHYSFQNFPVHPGVEDALRACRRFDHRCVTVYGEPGIAKTHLMVATAREYAVRGYSAVYVGATDYFERLRKVRDGDPPPPSLTAFDVVVLDDVDKLRRSDFVFERLYTLLDHFQTHPEKTLLLTAQVDPGVTAAKLTPAEEQAGAIASRMGLGYVKAMHGLEENGIEVDFRFAAGNRWEAEQ